FFSFRRLSHEGEDAERTSLTSARLALFGFLVAAFFISRLYSTVLQILLVLPIVQQMAATGTTSYFPMRSGTVLKDLGWIWAFMLAMFGTIFLFSKLG